MKKDKVSFSDNQPPGLTPEPNPKIISNPSSPEFSKSKDLVVIEDVAGGNSDSDEFVLLEDHGQNHQRDNNSQNDSNGSSIIQLNNQQLFDGLETIELKIQTQPQGDKSDLTVLQFKDFHFLLDSKDALQQFSTLEEWQQWIENVKKNSTQVFSSISQINSIISLSEPRNSQFRQLVWSRLVVQKQQEIIDALQKKQKQASVIKREEKRNKKIHELINKMFNKLDQIKDFVCYEKSIISTISHENLVQIILETIISYMDFDNQIALYRGLPNICLGLINSIPFQLAQKPHQISFTVFQYFMKEVKVRETFKNGMPLYCQEVKNLLKEINREVPKLFKKLESSNIDESRIFISYYKTLLINEIKDIRIIRKIIDLILVYKIEIIRFILLRVIKVRQSWLLENFKDSEELKKYIEINLITDYFTEQMKIVEIMPLEEQEVHITKIFKELIFSKI